MNDETEPKNYLTRNWKPVSIVTLIGMIPALIASNAWYENWHKEDGNSRYLQLIHAEQLYAKKAEVTQLAQVDELKQQVVQIDQNVDFLVKSAAVQAVDRIKSELTVLSFQDDGSPSWKRQQAELQSRLANAEAYRDCLFRETSKNCDASRVW